MRGIELKVITFLCARTCRNASTGASQVKILTSQSTIRIGLVPVSAWPSHDGKEGDGVKS